MALFFQRPCQADGNCYCGEGKGEGKGEGEYPNVRWVTTRTGETKPVVVGRTALWDPGNTAGKHPQCGNAATVAATLNAQARDSTNAQTGFSMVPVRIHGAAPAGLADVKAAIALLDPEVEVVDAFEFVRRLKLAAPRENI